MTTLKDIKKPRTTHTSDCHYNYGHDCNCSGTKTHANDCSHNYGHDCDCGYDNTPWDEKSHYSRASGRKAASSVRGESVAEARTKIGEYAHGANVTKVYKLSGEHFEGDPYHVKLFKGGKHYEPADYFTNDEGDAHGTAQHMVKESVEPTPDQWKSNKEGLEEGVDPIHKKITTIRL